MNIKSIIPLLFITFLSFVNCSFSTDSDFNLVNLEKHLLEIIPSLPDKEFNASDGFLLNEAWLAEINELPPSHKLVMLCCIDWIGFSYAAAVRSKDNNLSGEDFEKKAFHHVHLQLNNKSLKYVAGKAILNIRRLKPLWKLYIEMKIQ